MKTIGYYPVSQRIRDAVRVLRAAKNTETRDSSFWLGFAVAILDELDSDYFQKEEEKNS